MTPKKKIAYLLKMFPRFSETFILNEILELERQDVALSLISLKRPKESFRQASVAQVKSRVTYVPEPIAVRPFMFIRNLKTLWPVLKANLELYKKDPKRYRKAFIVCLRSKTPKASKRFLAAAYIANILLETGVHHLHAHFANDPATVAQFVHLLTGIPYSFTAHAKDIYLSKENLLAHKIQTAEFVVTCTDYNQRYLCNISRNNTPIYTIHHGIDWNLFSKQEKKPCHAQKGHSPSRRPPIVLSVGRLVEKKGFDCLIQACNFLDTWRIDFQCEIIGEGPLKSYLEELIRLLSLQPRVHITNFIPQEKLIHKYAQASVFALPSQISENGDRDGIPNVLLEAMAMGVPVVATNVSGITEVVDPLKNGFSVPPQDPFALATSLREILSQPAKYQILADRANETVRRDFDLSLNVSRLVNLFPQA